MHDMAHAPEKCILSKHACHGSKHVRRVQVLLFGASACKHYVTVLIRFLLGSRRTSCAGAESALVTMEQLKAHLWLGQAALTEQHGRNFLYLCVAGWLLMTSVPIHAAWPCHGRAAPVLCHSCSQHADIFQ